MSLHHPHKYSETQNRSLLSNNFYHYLPSISYKSVSPENHNEKEILKKKLIEKYTQKFTQNSKKKAFLVKKAIEDAFIRNNVSSCTMKKLSRSLYQEIKPPKNLPLEEEKLRSNIHENDLVLEQKQENVKLENPIPLQPAKKLLSEIIPGYRYRKQYYDFDEISMEESEVSQSEKSIYRLKTSHDEWAWLIKNDVDKYKAQIQKNQENLKKQQQKFKEELDKQLKEKEQSKEKQKRNEGMYHEIMLKQIKVGESNDKEEYVKRLKNQESAKMELDKQNEIFIKNQALEKKVDKKLKFFLNQKIQKEITEENVKIQLKKKRNLEINQEMMRESNENRKRLLFENQKEKEQDVKMVEDYMKDVEKMLIDRETQKRQRMEEIQKKYGNFSDSLKKFDGQKINMEDQIQMKYFKEKEEEEKQENIRRMEKIRQNKKLVKEVLSNQMREKEILKEKEIKMNKDQAEYWKQDTLVFLNEENQKKEKSKQRKLDYVEELKTQSNISKQFFSPEKKMNDEELLQNKDHLKLLALKEGDTLVVRDMIKIKKKNY